MARAAKPRLSRLEHPKKLIRLRRLREPRRSNSMPFKKEVNLPSTSRSIGQASLPDMASTATVRQLPKKLGLQASFLTICRRRLFHTMNSPSRAPNHTNPISMTRLGTTTRATSSGPGLPPTIWSCISPATPLLRERQASKDCESIGCR